tara:strand:- start:34046 stop:34198 length:153 start_codon:yes stop_codon:yes gene_type:complete
MIGLALLIATLVTFGSFCRLSDGGAFWLAVPFCFGLYAMAMCIVLIVWGV